MQGVSAFYLFGQIVVNDSYTRGRAAAVFICNLAAAGNHRSRSRSCQVAFGSMDRSIGLKDRRLDNLMSPWSRCFHQFSQEIGRDKSLRLSCFPAGVLLQTLLRERISVREP